MYAPALSLALFLVAQPPAEPAKAAKPAPFSLTIEGPVTPALAPTAGRLAALFYESYPKVVKRFEHPDRPAPRRIRVVFDPELKIPAYCSGNKLVVSSKWLTDHPDDVGLLTHELTHAVQAYPASDPGWLTEGIADYARQKYGPDDQPGWSLPRRLTGKQKHTDSYRTTARFLVWLDDAHPGSVDKLHRAMQDRTYTPDTFKEATGKTVDELWAVCVKDLDKAVKPAPARP